MSSINKVILIGNLGRDPEVRYMPNGTAVCNLALATSRQWKNKESGEKQEETEWHRVSMFDRLAEIAGEYLKKGAKVYVEGRLKTRKWQDKDGKDVYTTEVICEEMKMLSGRNDGDSQDGGNQRSQGAQQRSQGSQQSGAASSAANGRSTSNQRQSNQSRSAIDDMDDDIPF